jgi:hypothetical protein
MNPSDNNDKTIYIYRHFNNVQDISAVQLRYCAVLRSKMSINEVKLLQIKCHIKSKFAYLSTGKIIVMY